MYNTNIAIIEEQKSSCAPLDFNNPKCIEFEEIAEDSLKAAKVLNENSANLDNSSKKAVYKKATQSAMESVEAVQKAVVYADMDAKNIKDKSGNKHQELAHSHNNGYLQKELENAGINILEKSDIKKLTGGISLNENTPYNAIRFYSQNISAEQADTAIKVAEKALNNFRAKKTNQYIQDLLETIY